MSEYKFIACCSTDNSRQCLSAERNMTSRGRTCGKCRLHGEVVPLKGHARVCPYGRCFCARCSTHEELLALRSKQREAKEDKGRIWRANLASTTQRKGTTSTCTSTSTTTTSSFPDNTNFAENSMLALQMANYETQAKRVKKNMSKAEQRKGITERFSLILIFSIPYY